MKVFGWVFFAILLAVSISVFGCNDSTTLNRPQPPYSSDDIGGGHGSGGGGGQ